MSGKRDFIRKSGYRDSRLIIIASEGEVTEKKYFDGIKNYYQNKKVHVELLDPIEKGSAPEKVIRMLDKFKKEHACKQGYDQLWLVIDVDRWGEKISDIAEKCHQKQYSLAVSNPEFEIWLLLHVRDLSEYSENKLKELRENRKVGNRTRISAELKELLKKYNKANPDMGYFSPRAIQAIENAKRIDLNTKSRWPNDLGSRVYLIVENIIPKNFEI